MTLVFDHLFICTSVGAPEAEALRQLGLFEGSSNDHLGQGTRNRRFFFRNAMLELLWVVNEQEVESDAIAPTRLGPRWRYRQNGECPFGLLFRQDPQQTSSSLPFSTWDFCPPYLPAPLKIDVAAGTASTEPLIAVIPFGGRPDGFSSEHRQPLEHPLGVQEVTQVRLTLPQPLSRAVGALQSAGLVSFASGPDYLAELEFDDGTQGKVSDLRPALPLCLRW